MEDFFGRMGKASYFLFSIFNFPFWDDEITKEVGEIKKTIMGFVVVKK